MLDVNIHKTINKLTWKRKTTKARIKGPFIFYERGGAGGIWGGGHSKKIGLKGGTSRKKMKERGGGGSDEKN